MVRPHGPARSGRKSIRPRRVMVRSMVGQLKLGKGSVPGIWIDCDAGVSRRVVSPALRFLKRKVLATTQRDAREAATYPKTFLAAEPRPTPRHSQRHGAGRTAREGAREHTAQPSRGAFRHVTDTVCTYTDRSPGVQTAHQTQRQARRVPTRTRVVHRAGPARRTGSPMDGGHAMATPFAERHVPRRAPTSREEPWRWG